MVNDEEIKELIRLALDARKFAYAPYSKFSVGAALLTESGIYTGCNVENAAFGPSNCAERTAVFKAVSEGEKHFRAIAIVAGGILDKPSQYTSPCGVCRQVLREFVSPNDFLVIMAKDTDDYRVMSLEELLPEGFGPHNINSL